MCSFPPLLRLQFRFRAREAITLAAFKGSPWRGLFGATFKGLTCAIKNTECHRCMLESSCLYRTIFESPETGEKKRFAPGANAVPHPFFLLPPLDDRRQIPKDETFTSEIALVGPALRAIPHVILTFREMGRRGIGSSQAKFELEEALFEDGREWVSCYRADEESFYLPQPPSPTPIPSANGHDCQQVRLKTRTPMRLKHRGRLVDNLTFPIIMRALLRRLDDMSRLYGEGPLQADIPGLVSKAETIRTTTTQTRWTDVRRFSSRQKSEMVLGGVEGELVFRGDLKPFYSWLRLGETWRIGKATSFGFGVYDLEWDQ